MREGQQECQDEMSGPGRARAVTSTRNGGSREGDSEVGDQIHSSAYTEENLR